MKNNLKIILCLLFTVLLPFSLVACKTKNSDNNGETGQNQGNNPGGSQEQGYVLNDSEIARIIGTSVQLNDNFVEKLNSSDILKTNSYLEEVGSKTYPILNNAYYPAVFFDLYNNDEKNDASLENNKVYAYKNDGFCKFLKIIANDNNKFSIVIVTNENNGYFEFFNFEYRLENGTLNSLKISFLQTANKSQLISFSEALLDYKNLNFEAGIGNVNWSSEKYSSRQFFENNFTKNNFSAIKNEDWGYSFYEKFCFSENKSYVCDTEKMPENVHLNSQFDSFGFIDAFDFFDEFSAIPNLELSIKTTDYFYSSDLDNRYKMNYDHSKFTFEKAR